MSADELKYCTKMHTGASVQAEVGVSDLHGCDGGVENPVLSSSAVAVVTEGKTSDIGRSVIEVIRTSGREYRWP